MEQKREMDGGGRETGRKRVGCWGMDTGQSGPNLSKSSRPDLPVDETHIQMLGVRVTEPIITLHVKVVQGTVGCY